MTLFDIRCQGKESFILKKNYNLIHLLLVNVSYRVLKKNVFQNG